MLNANTVSASNGMSAEDWGLFGGGPWLSSGTVNAPRLVRFYELMGMHDRSSRFVTRDWLSALSASALDEANGFSVSTTRSTVSLKNAMLLDFAVAPPIGGGSFAFGMALDPDLGSNAGDDENGYDATRDRFMPRTTPASSDT